MASCRRRVGEEVRAGYTPSRSRLSDAVGGSCRADGPSRGARRRRRAAHRPRCRRECAIGVTPSWRSARGRPRAPAPPVQARGNATCAVSCRSRRRQPRGRCWRPGAAVMRHRDARAVVRIARGDGGAVRTLGCSRMMTGGQSLHVRLAEDDPPALTARAHGRRRCFRRTNSRSPVPACWQPGHVLCPSPPAARRAAVLPARRGPAPHHGAAATASAHPRDRA